MNGAFWGYGDDFEELPLIERFERVNSQLTCTSLSCQMGVKTALNIRGREVEGYRCLYNWSVVFSNKLATPRGEEDIRSFLGKCISQDPGTCWNPAKSEDRSGEIE